MWLRTNPMLHIRGISIAWTVTAGRRSSTRIVTARRRWIFMHQLIVIFKQEQWPTSSTLLQKVFPYSNFNADPLKWEICFEIKRKREKSSYTENFLTYLSPSRRRSSLSISNIKSSYVKSAFKIIDRDSASTWMRTKNSWRRESKEDEGAGSSAGGGLVNWIRRLQFRRTGGGASISLLLAAVAAAAASISSVLRLLLSISLLYLKMWKPRVLRLVLEHETNKSLCLHLLSLSLIFPSLSL